MKINTFGDKSNKAVLMLHGGGLSWWSIKYHIDALTMETEYYVIAPTIDGHGDDSSSTFESIQDTADKLIKYIDSELGGKIHAIWGLSIGGQIAVEVLSRNENIADFALIESALVIPIKMASMLAEPTYNITYSLIKKKWFSKLQSASLFIPKSMFYDYYNDSSKMSKKSLINMTISNSTYFIPEGLDKSNANTLVIVGSKEIGAIKKSAYLLNKTLKNSGLVILEKNGHGQMCMQNPKSHIELIKSFISGNF